MNETLKSIDFNIFKEHQHLVRYIDKDIAIVENLNSIIDSKAETCKMNCFLTIFCLEGEIMINLNHRQFLLKSEHCAIILPGTIVQKAICNQQYKVRIIAFSNDFYSQTVKLDPNIWNIVQYIYNNPIIPISETESYKMYLFKELTIQLIDESPHPFSHLVKHHFFASTFCEMLAYLNEKVPEYEKMEFNRSRSSAIFRQFMEEVSKDDGTHRSVSYYADRLCYTSKHLSTVIKLFSGKTPIRIINEHAIQKIKYYLKHSDMSIKQVADHFEFVNPSFFGKFVKAHTGMSPLQDRNSAEKE